MLKILRLKPALSMLLGLTLASSVAAQSQDAAGNQLDPQAVQRLKTSMDYLANLQQFAFDTESTIEAVMDSGQKIQFGNAISAVVKRPNKMRVSRMGELLNQVFYYNGNSLTLHNPDDGFYATLAAPDTLEAMLDFARDSLDIVAPAGDFIYSNNFEILMEGVQSGFIVGPAEITGEICDHLAFSSGATSWQIWIQRGDHPLPRKLVITSNDVLSAPQFALTLDAWDLEPDTANEMFEFEAPENDVAIEFITLDSSSN
jgi:hypothetical protein